MSWYCITCIGQQLVLYLALLSCLLHVYCVVKLHFILLFEQIKKDSKKKKRKDLRGHGWKGNGRQEKDKWSKREEGSFRCHRFLDLPLNPCLHLHGWLSFSADCSKPAREIRSLNWSIRGLCCYAESNVINQPLLCRCTHPAAGCWYHFCILGRKQNNSRERKCAENYIILHNKYILLNCNQHFGNFKP